MCQLMCPKNCYIMRNGRNGSTVTARKPNVSNCSYQRYGDGSTAEKCGASYPGTETQ